MEKIRIIIVDDHEIVRDGIIAMMMTVEDVELIGEAGTAEALFNLLTQKIPDVLLLDITLPDISGLEIAKKMHDSFNEVKILILSADGCEQNIFDAIDAGVDGFILKDMGRETLLQAIRAVNRGEHFFDNKISQVVLKQLLRKKEEETFIGKNSHHLSQRETNVLALLSDGFSHKQIAARLFISKRTVDAHIDNIKNKLNLHSKVELVKYAIKNQIINI